MFLFHQRSYFIKVLSRRLYLKTAFRLVISGNFYLVGLSLYIYSILLISRPLSICHFLYILKLKWLFSRKISLKTLFLTDIQLTIIK